MQPLKRLRARGAAAQAFQAALLFWGLMEMGHRRLPGPSNGPFTRCWTYFPERWDSGKHQGRLQTALMHCANALFRNKSCPKNNKVLKLSIGASITPPGDSDECLPSICRRSSIEQLGATIAGRRDMCVLDGSHQNTALSEDFDLRNSSAASFGVGFVLRGDGSVIRYAD